MRGPPGASQTAPGDPGVLIQGKRTTPAPRAPQTPPRRFRCPHQGKRTRHRGGGFAVPLSLGGLLRALFPVNELRSFQRRFIRGATAPGIDTAVFCQPRASGKSWLAGHLVARVLTPGDALFRPGTESVLCAASIEQARIVFRNIVVGGRHVQAIAQEPDGGCDR